MRSFSASPSSPLIRSIFKFSPGGASSFGGHAITDTTGGGIGQVAPGSGPAVAGLGGAAGVGTTGEPLLKGGGGIPGFRMNATEGMGGNGGDSSLGGGGRGGINTSAGAGGGAFGGGGGGAAADGATGQIGGPGSSGLIIVEEFY